MSIENAILELAAAIRELAGASRQPAAKPAAEEVFATTKPTAAEAVAQAKADAAAANAKKNAPTAAAPAAAPEAVQESPTDAPAITYEDVTKIILGLSKAGRKADAIALLGQFGATKGPELKPEQYAEFVAAGTPMLNGAA